MSEQKYICSNKRDSSPIWFPGPPPLSLTVSLYPSLSPSLPHSPSVLSLPLFSLSSLFLPLFSLSSLSLSLFSLSLSLIFSLSLSLSYLLSLPLFSLSSLSLSPSLSLSSPSLLSVSLFSSPAVSSTDNTTFRRQEIKWWPWRVDSPRRGAALPLMGFKLGQGGGARRGGSGAIGRGHQRQRSAAWPVMGNRHCRLRRGAE